MSRLRNFPVLSAIILLGLVVRLYYTGLSGWGLTALVIAVIWFGLSLIHWLVPDMGGRVRRRLSGKASPPNAEMGAATQPVSLVYFLSEAREGDEASIRTCVGNALGVRFRVNDPDSDTYVIPFTPPERGEREMHIRHYMVRVPEGLFAVLISDQPYIENPVDFARDAIRDKRLRSAVEKHEAWISVDLLDDPESPSDRLRAYRIIGKILGSLAGPDCLAVYSPELQRCNEFDPGLLERLAGENPLTLFDEPTFEPVIEVSDNNPKMAAAVREAISRWPEFVAAYRSSRDPERSQFIVKAEFREGRKSEFMWVSVQEITDTTISGILMNDPHELIECHRGASVTLTMDRLNDWIYPTGGGQHIGGFTLDVLADSGEE